MDFKYFGFSDMGQIHGHNEDSYLCNADQRLFLVADGMGGHSSGEMASRLAVISIEEFVIQSRAKTIKWPIEFRNDLSLEQNRLLNATIYGNQVIRNFGIKNPSMMGMGTTLVGAIIEEDQLAIVNVGDSRIYQIRNSTIRQITDDHTLAEEQEKGGIITKKQAEIHPYRHVLTLALGHIDNLSKIDISTIKINQKDL